MFMLLIKTIVLKTGSDRTGQSDRFNWESVFNPVRLWQKTENSLKTGK